MISKSVTAKISASSSGDRVTSLPSASTHNLISYPSTSVIPKVFITSATLEPFGNNNVVVSVPWLNLT